MPSNPPALKKAIRQRISGKKPESVWSPMDFLDLGNRDAVDKTLQRLTQAGELRRIGRGLYDKPAVSRLTKKPKAPDYHQLIQLVERRDQCRILVDGMTAANDLGLTDAVPSRIILHTDARICPMRLGNLVIEFKPTAPSKLYWAGRPAMRVVQALHWLKDILPGDRDRIMGRLRSILKNPTNGLLIREDLRKGLSTLPAWMQGVARDLLNAVEGSKKPNT
ncbi:MAG: hypothetical protein EBY32_04330 [Proteobacteria bacterium]|jgi:hypothetical protein|nr:hypothetical protein [Pseudomonadota bacterium]